MAIRSKILWTLSVFVAGAGIGIACGYLAANRPIVAPVSKPTLAIVESKPTAREPRYNLSQWERAGQIVIPSGSVGSLVFSVDGKALFAAIPGRREEKTHPTGGTYVTGRSEIRCWEIPSGRLLGSVNENECVIEGLSVTPDGKTLISSGIGQARSWNTSPFGSRSPIGNDYGTGLTSASSPDGQLLAMGGRTPLLYDAETLEPKPFSGDGEDYPAFTPNGRYLSWSSYLWDLQSNHGGKFEGHWLSHRVFSRDSRTMISIGAKYLEVLHIDEDGKLVFDRTTRLATSPSCLDISMKGELIAIAPPMTNSVFIFSMPNLELRCSIPAAESDVLSLAFSKADLALATSDGKKTIRLWRPRRLP